MSPFRKTYAIEVYQYPTTKQTAHNDAEELRSLIDAAGYFLADSELYQLRTLHLDTLFGSGKLEELKSKIINQHIDLIIIDFPIKPYALKNIEDYFNIEVMDRTRLILEIFKQRATSAEGKLQVQLAEAQYELGRVSGGKGKELSRLGGGVGTRGPGEKKLETDRRAYERKIKILRQKLAQVSRNRMQQYEQRRKLNYPLISLAGYTNAGKSTLLNALAQTNVQAKNELFTTVDPTTRKIFIKGKEFLVTDTVGFINKLPTELVEGFESTLEQITLSDLVVTVVDRSDPFFKDKQKKVVEILRKLKVQCPIIYAYNKIDMLDEGLENLEDNEHIVHIAAAQQQGLDKLKDLILTTLS